jgi:hypothetical protein
MVALLPGTLLVPAIECIESGTNREYPPLLGTERLLKSSSPSRFKRFCCDRNLSRPQNMTRPVAA